MLGPKLGLAAYQAYSECIRLLVLVIHAAVKARILKSESGGGANSPNFQICTGLKLKLYCLDGSGN